MLEIANQIVILAKNQEAWQSALAAVTERSIYMLPAWVKEMLAGSMENAAGIAAAIVSSIPVLHIGKVASMAIINFIVSIPVCYFTLVEGERFVESIVSLLPQREKDAYWRYIGRIDRILSGIYIGTIYTSILGSMIAASIFYAFGMPRPFALASIIFLAGMVPILTSWMVIIPLAVYRYFTAGLEGAPSSSSSPQLSFIFPQSFSSGHTLWVPSHLFTPCWWSSPSLGALWWQESGDSSWPPP